jgi:alkylation response protein AidB-like acyl-CoA dehydrogenase
MDLMGAEAMLYGDYASGGVGTGSLADIAKVAFLRSRANTIEGGTAEIMRNILGERVLGLPGDVRVDRDRPWKDVPRS